MIINETTRIFIAEHADDDVRKLALLGTKQEDVDLPMALQQIAGRQMARKKLPSWAAVDGIIYPPHLNMEQCSSEQTARYKQGLITHLEGREKTFVDLTGGFGVDFYWMSQGFEKRIYVEQNAALCAISSENFRTLELECDVCCCDTANYLTEMPKATVVYLDPARRNEHGGRTYGIADCTPNVLELLPLLLAKADRIILKLSPMLDWRKAVEDMQMHHASVSEVHIVSVDNECKELLLVIDKEMSVETQLACVNLHLDGSSEAPLTLSVRKARTGSPNGSDCQSAPIGLVTNQHLDANNLFLYEPNASIMKAGCFEQVERQFAVRQLSTNSHLFVSNVEVADFPGRKFQVCAISSMNKQELKTALAAISQANITIRNFPLSVEQLRKKLKLKDGGNTYIFATTLSDGQHKLLICRKIG